MIQPGTTNTLTWNNQKIRYYAPVDIASARILIVMHGQTLDARSYRDAWRDKAKEAKALLIVPEFDTTQYPGDAYTLGPKSFAQIEPLFDFVKAEAKNPATNYLLYGHSAGAQFVHRLVLLKATRAIKSVAANAGWYTVPELVSWPYGLKGAPTGMNESRLLKHPLTILLGENDTNPDDPDLRHTANADRQGLNRLERGKFFFKAGQAEAVRLAMMLQWRIQTVPGAEHSNSDMVPAAAKILLG